jgi:hypothetical protein
MANGTTLFGVSKSTIQGILSLLVGILTSLLTYQVPSALVTPRETHVWLWITVGINITLLALKAVVGYLQGDAPSLN